MSATEHNIYCHECGEYNIAHCRDDWTAHMAESHPDTSLQDWEFGVSSTLFELTIFDLLGPREVIARLKRAE